MSKGIAGAPSDKAEALAAKAEAEAEQTAQAEAVAKARAEAEQVARAKADEESRARRAAAIAAAKAQADKDAAAAKPTVDETPLAKVRLDEVAELRAQAEAERDRLAALGSEYDARLTRERNRDRVAALRGMGALASLTDDQLLAIAPDVDPHAPGGAAQLDEWREKNSGLFVAKTGPSIPSPDELLATMPQRRSASGLYDEKYFADLMKRNLGG